MFDIEKFVTSKSPTIARNNAEYFELFFSFSGVLLINEELPELELDLDGTKIIVGQPFRLSHPSFRANPQFNLVNANKFMPDFDMQFPLQVAAQPETNADASASIQFYGGYGEGDQLADEAKVLPADSLRVRVFTNDLTDFYEKVPKYVVEPLLDGVRNLTGQWWGGRSYEAVTGALHFIIPVNAESTLEGSAIPICGVRTASDDLVPLDAALWKKASNYIGFKQSSSWRTLELQAYHNFASRDYFGSCVLGCGAIESLRDQILDKAGKKKSDFNTSETDLLKHLSIGLGTLFGRNLRDEEPETFEQLRAIWIARGDAAHGRRPKWITKSGAVPLEDLAPEVFNRGLSRVLRWCQTVDIT
ncbi:hypothetical protein EH31_03585 [Erythrobacter longus]|uniref:Uncharacterized protein n=1 Tax=Erythrobacter longus TaxID=1044 RepID=A0A074MG36_ERYLO|nr:hypothetical protein [Erythrobacter longus]KEO91765.1 hypothetical protein EH31_03585 [Erythrobacter longus]